MKSLIIGAVLAAGLAAAPAHAQEAPEKRCEKFEQALRMYGLPVKQFSYIAWRESKCVLKAVGWNYHNGKSAADCRRGNFESHRKCDAVKSYDVGLLQINSTWRTVTRRLCAHGRTEVDMIVLKDLGCNLRVAKYLFDNGGYAHWGLQEGYTQSGLSRASVGGERGGSGNCTSRLPNREANICGNNDRRTK
jgi:hypothetical protein